MAFIRLKARGERRYAYLVESRWDPQASSPRQAILAYLGPADQVDASDVPREYRDEPAVARWLASRAAPPESGARDFEPQREALRLALLSGSRERVEEVAQRAIRHRGFPVFLEGVLAPAMRQVGEDWHGGRVRVDQEHTATRLAGDLVRRLRDQARRPARGGLRILLANPKGEQHALALDVLECALARLGHQTVVVAGGAPHRDVAKRAAEIRAQLVLVSATNVASAERALALADAILERAPGALVALGGQAWGTTPPRGLHPRVRVARPGPAALGALLEEAAAPGGA